MVDLNSVSASLLSHESRSQARFEELKSIVSQSKENEMTHEKEAVEVNNIFKGKGHGMESILPMLGTGGFGGGSAIGAGALGFVAGAVLGGNGNGGLFGGDSNGNSGTVQELTEIATLTKVGDSIAATQLAAANTQNVVNTTAAQTQTATLQQTIELNNAISQQSLSQQAQIANVKDAVQTSLLASLSAISGVSTNVDKTGSMLAASIVAEGQATRALINEINTANLGRELSDTKAALIELRSDSVSRAHAREVEVNVTQTVNQNQAQSQAQQQFQILANLAAQVQNLANDVQIVRQSQSTVNFGTMTGSGQTASAANTRVN
jgi:hypothetical protein